MVIAIDGPAGAGKSTVARLLAKSLGYSYLDTGAMYRAVAWALRAAGCPLDDELRLAGELERLPLQCALEGAETVIAYQGHRLADELRDPEITRLASRVSQIGAVRTLLTGWQRQLAASGDIVAEGRDMGTVVFPDAALKVYLTADLATRARRRQLEYEQKGVSIDHAQLESQIEARDDADERRALAPLRPAGDALQLDTSGLNPEQAVRRILTFLREKTRGKSCNSKKSEK
jgi:cytidylate kinase